MIFAPLFFPSVDATTGTLASFATFGVGFLTRPIGGIIFGHFGDRIGRKSMLVITVMTIGIGTFLIGCLPTYASIGVAAPILLVVLRLVQGPGLGGEYAGAALMTIEHAPAGHKGFWGSVPQAAVPGGVLLSTAALALVSAFGRDALLADAWRIPFLFSAVLLVVGLVIRLRLEESPDFAAARASGTVARVPLLKLVCRYPRTLALTVGVRLAETVTFNTLNAFALYYVSTVLGVDSQLALLGIVIGSGIGVFAVPALGALGDRIGRARIYLAGTIAGVVLVVPMFLLFDTRSTGAIWFAFALVYVCVPCVMFAVESVYFAELFADEDVRYTGLSIAYQLSAIAGGYVPTIGTVLLLVTGGTPWLFAGVFAGSCVLSALCVLLLRPARFETRRAEEAKETLLVAA